MRWQLDILRGLIYDTHQLLIAACSPHNCCGDAGFVQVSSSLRRRERAGQFTMPPPADRPTDIIDEGGTQMLPGEERKRRIYLGKPAVPGFCVIGEEPLGRGSFGEVWLAEAINCPEKKVAIKVFNHGADQRWNVTLESLRVGQFFGTHGIVQLIDCSATAERPYIVMNYAEGGSVQHLIEIRGKLSVREAVPIFAGAVRALAYVHLKNILHCDIKPANLLLDARTEPILADFGQAQFSQSASPTMGTFFYMAPEQAEIERPLLDARWDVYSLGAVLYAMLTGHPPRSQGNLSTKLDEMRSTSTPLEAHLKTYREGLAAEPPPRDHWNVRGMDRALGKLIDRCLSLDPAARPRDAGEVLAELERRQRWLRQRPIVRFGVIATVLLCAVGLGMASASIRTNVKLAENEFRQRLFVEGRTLADLNAYRLQDLFRDRCRELKKRAADLGLRRAVATVHDKIKGRPVNNPLMAITQDDRDPVDDWLTVTFASHGEDEDRVSELFPSGMSVVVAADGRGYFISRIDATATEAGAPQLALNQPYRSAAEGGDPDDEKLFSAEWAWRDWFSGGGNKTEGQAYPPLTKTHISQPYLSRRKSVGVVIDFATPIFRENNRTEVVGILKAGIRVRQFDDIAKKPIAHDAAGPKTQDGYFITVVDDNDYLVAHRDAERAILLAQDRNPKPYHSDEQRHALAHHSSGEALAMSDYRDPLDSTRSHPAAAMCFAPNPDDNRRWQCIIQYDEDVALAPVSRMRANVASRSGSVLLTMAVLGCALWIWLVVLLRRAERTAHV